MLDSRKRNSAAAYRILELFISPCAITVPNCIPYWGPILLLTSPLIDMVYLDTTNDANVNQTMEFRNEVVLVFRTPSIE